MKRLLSFLICFGILLFWSSCRNDFEFSPCDCYPPPTFRQSQGEYGQRGRRQNIGGVGGTTIRASVGMKDAEVAVSLSNSNYLVGRNAGRNFITKIYLINSDS